MLVIATEETVVRYEDVEASAHEFGEVLLVMRLGGRHMQWGDPLRKLETPDIFQSPIEQPQY
jgi:hypothetical protein